MKVKASVVAQKLLNLYRQEHVIVGGWAAVNRVFVAEADNDVISELRNLPNGRTLIQHIENLRDGTTAMDSIERDLLPYGGMMTDSAVVVPLTAAEWTELSDALDAFVPDQNGLNALMELPVIKKFGDEWQPAIRNALRTHPEMKKKWAVVIQTYRAYTLWNTATAMLNEPLSERARAQIQADMPEYETYMPMFGPAGDELLAKLRAFITTREPISTDNAPDAPTSI